MTTTHTSLKKTAIQLFLPLILFVNSLAAQQKPAKFSASLTGGLSFPTGKFAAKESISLAGLTDVDGGAKTGWNGIMKLSAGLSSKVWATVTIGLAHFKRDDAAVEKVLSMIYGNDVTANAGSWKVFKALAGPSFRLPLGDRLSIRPAISAGILKTAVPAFSYAIMSQGGSPAAAFERSKLKMPATFAYEGGVGLAYKINPKISLLADFSYFGGQAKYKYNAATAATGTAAPPIPEYKFDLNFFSTSVGVEFAF